MKSICKECNKNGIYLIKKVMIRKSHNLRCTECNAEYNYSATARHFIHLLSAVLGTVFFYFLIFSGGIVGIAVGLVVVFVLVVLLMIIMPMKNIKDSR